jgi:hypothetical protein
VDSEQRRACQRGQAQGDCAPGQGEGGWVRGLMSLLGCLVSLGCCVEPLGLGGRLNLVVGRNRSCLRRVLIVPVPHMQLEPGTETSPCCCAPCLPAASSSAGGGGC